MNKGMKKNVANLQQRMQLKIYLVLFLVMLLITANRVQAAEMADMPANDTPTTEQQTTTPATTETNTTEQTEGKLVTKKGNTYYEYADGTKAKKTFVEIQGKTYYFGKKGVMQKGWMKKGKGYIYFDRSTGVQKKDKEIDGIKLDKKGQAKKSSYNNEKIKTMLKANSIMNKVTKPTDTKEQKLKKVFDWVLKHQYKRHRIFAKVRSEKGWEMTFANDIYGVGTGCCVSEACALAFLAHECGYKDVYVCDDTGHAWVEINGHVYDTLFAEAKSYKKYYNSTYKTAGLHRVNKLKI